MSVEVVVTDSSHPITAGLLKGFTFGGRFRDLKRVPKWYPANPPISPVLLASDRRAKVLGVVKGLNEPGLAVKDFGKWRSVWVAAHVLPAPLLRNLCKFAGVHVYDEAEDIIYVNKSWLAIHFSSDGARTIKLPKTLDYRRCPYKGGRDQGEACFRLACSQRRE